MIKDKIKTSGLRMTPQRMAIIEFLEGNIDHPSAEDIFRAVSERFPGISIATIYNTLDILRKKGLIDILEIDPERKRCDPNILPHHHFICKRCKRIYDIFRDIKIDIPEEEFKEISISETRIEFFGLCERCKKYAG